MHNFLFCARTVCLNNVTETFLLVSSSVSSKRLVCFEHDQGQKRTKNIQERTWPGFIIIPFYYYDCYACASFLR